MQFVKDGPDIPERLLEAHEDGKVVFFCGAGISYKAGLPGFKGLVEGIYNELGAIPSSPEKAAIKAGQYDTALALLEGRVAGKRAVVRQALVKTLTPKLAAPGALSFHEALLTLSKTREGRHKLITTNFDRLFQEVIKRNAMEVPAYKAPLLPTPKTRLNGLIYLHGLIPEPPTVGELDQLIISSGDFGMSYLTDRWAARFVSELFRVYTVCFVGYSINDPVLRYMMDALAADRLLCESSPEMFAFGSYSPGKMSEKSIEWSAKNVTPVMYKATKSHALLERTLTVWAETYRDGVTGKEKIVVANALVKPVTSTAQDDFVGRMIWALSDKQALPAKRFAEHDPLPSLEWLDPLIQQRFSHVDLVRFQIAPDREIDRALTFSLLHRPTPYKRASWMSLVLVDRWSVGEWDDVMYQLARWLVRHLDDPKLLLWIAGRGGPIHPLLGALVKERLSRDPPRPIMRTLWRLVLAGRLAYRTFDISIYEFSDRLATESPGASMRLEFRRFLTPRVTLRQPIRLWPGEESTEPSGSETADKSISEVVDWDIVLTAEHAHSALEDLGRSPNWTPLLRGFLLDATALLRDAMDLRRELGGAEDRSDLSYVHQPSIAPHPQNRDFHDWTVLIDVARDAWLLVSTEIPQQALAEANRWMEFPYPIFKRLAFFAGVHPTVVPPQTALAWIVSDSGWWVWSIETGRESFRLMSFLASVLPNHDLATLEQLVLAGPPREMFRDELTDAEFQRVVDREVWLRLMKLSAAGGELSPTASERLNLLSSRYPVWELAEDERDEFAFWMGSSDEKPAGVVVTPRRRQDLVRWLRDNPTSQYGRDDDWADRCKRDFATTASALMELARAGEWPVDRWRSALQAWADEKLSYLAWRRMGKVIGAMPTASLQPLAHTLSWWLQAVGRRVIQPNEFFALLSRVLAACREEEVREPEAIVGRAINNPVGQVIEAATKWWYRQSLQDNQRLQEPVRALFSTVCSREFPIFQYGRVLLAHHLIALFRVDPDWTRENMFPFFSWRASPADARVVWQGFLWAPRLYAPLIDALQDDLLETADHYEELGKFDSQYADLLTFAALEGVQATTPRQFAKATSSLPQQGLAKVAETVARALDGAGDQKSEYWRNRVVPYLRLIWPKAAVPSKSISSAFAKVCINAGLEFQAAVTFLSPWLIPTDDDLVVHRLTETDLPTQFPETSLDFLGMVVDEKDWMPPRELKDCLDTIAAARPELQAHPTFQRLVASIRRRTR